MLCLVSEPWKVINYLFIYLISGCLHSLRDIQIPFFWIILLLGTSNHTVLVLMDNLESKFRVSVAHFSPSSINFRGFFSFFQDGVLPSKMPIKFGGIFRGKSLSRVHPKCEGSRETQLGFFWVFFSARTFSQCLTIQESKEREINGRGWRTMWNSEIEEQRRRKNKVPQGKGTGCRQGRGYRDILSFLSSSKSCFSKLTWQAQQFHSNKKKNPKTMRDKWQNWHWGLWECWSGHVLGNQD